MYRSNAEHIMKEAANEVIEAFPDSDLGILADLLIGAVVDEINEHIKDPDDYVVYDLF